MSQLRERWSSVLSAVLYCTVRGVSLVGGSSRRLTSATARPSPMNDDEEGVDDDAGGGGNGAGE